MQLPDKYKRVLNYIVEVKIFFDVSALIISIKPSLEKETLSLLFTNDTNLAKNTELQCQSLLEFNYLYLTTRFHFNNNIYEQTGGTSMRLVQVGYLLNTNARYSQ